ncbi:hypothetical protein Gorai_002978, partial [Gossypium raimondii]|nr:hypothetical protein [Gossypium raimondii]
AVDDYNRVLTQGPWIVYGQYLTVQLWTKLFRPSQPYPSVTDNQTRGRITHLAVYINLEKPLISQVIVDGAVQRVEYEALLTVSREKEPGFRLWILVERKSSWRVKRDLSGEGLAKQTKNPLGSRFLVLMVDKDLSDNAGLSAGEIVGEKANVEVAANSMSFKTRVNKKCVRGFLVDASHGGNVGLGLFRGTVMNDNLDSVALESLGQNFNDFLDKFLGKRPTGLGGFINNNGGSMAKLPASIFSSSASAGSKHACLQNNTPINDASGQGNLDSRNQANIEVEDLEKNKAHYNLVFDESEGLIVPISDNILDLEVLDSALGSNLTGPRDRISSARDS